jgi:elongation factor P hydroxylase
MRDASQSEIIKWSWLYREQAANPENPQPLPGPYSYAADTWGVDDVWEITSRDDKCIAYFQYWDEGDGKSARIEANFRLLAAAPELVDALKALLAAVAGLPFTLLTGGLRRAVRNARAAIVKAMGQT